MPVSAHAQSDNTDGCKRHPKWKSVTKVATALLAMSNYTRANRSQRIQEKARQSVKE
jgi:hypothetical protein